MHSKQWFTAGRLGLVLAAASVIAGCANPRPAPVVHRTNAPTLPAPVASPPLPPPVAVQAPTPMPGPGGQAGQQGGDAVGGVEVMPIRSGGIESGSIASGPAASGSNLKTGPKGLKRPYEEVAIVPTTAAPAASAVPAPPPAPPKAPEPPPVSSGTGLLDGVAFGWPSGGTVLQNFNETSSKGVSLSGKAGDVVRAAADGRVIFSGAGPRGYGNLIIVKHQNELLSVYAHNRSLAVKEGENVKRGQKIAELGDSGTDKPKLHFEIRQQGKPIDPLAVLPRR
jgi:lipoprotein NlpD